MKLHYAPVQIRDQRGTFAAPVERLRSTPWLFPGPQRPPIPEGSRLLCAIYTAVLVLWPLGIVSWAISHLVIDIHSGFDPPPPSMPWIRELSIGGGAVAWMLAWVFWTRHWRRVGAQRSAEMIARQGQCPVCDSNLSALGSSFEAIPCPTCGAVWNVGGSSAPPSEAGSR